MERLDERFQEALQSFWTGRETQLQKQIASGKLDAGTRGAVTGGGHMGALEALIVALLVDVGIEQADIKVKVAGAKPQTPLAIPRYYRPQKQWDVLVVAQDQLVAAIEFKSQVGSIGNNLNNRAEEAIGLAQDFWTAFRDGRLGTRRPFLGFFLLVEDSAKILVRYVTANLISLSIRSFKEHPISNGIAFFVNDLSSSDCMMRRV